MIKYTVSVLCFALLLCFVRPATAQPSCALPPRIVQGEAGRVLFTDGAPLNVRASNSRAAAIIGQIVEGSSFQVLEGASCADSIHWWRIERGKVSGWIAEGADAAYFVAPISLAQFEADQDTAAALEQLDPETRLLLRNSAFQLTDLIFTPLAELPAGRNPRISGSFITRLEADALVVWSADGDQHTIPAPVAATTDRLVDAALDPSGTAVVWFYEACDTSAFNCDLRQQNTLYLTDASGANLEQLWQGAPLMDAVDLFLDGWHSEFVVLRHHSLNAFPEPGSDPDADHGYAPLGGAFIIIAPDGSETVYSSFPTDAAVSADAAWIAYDTGERFSRNVESNTLRVESTDGVYYDLLFPAANRIYRLRFSPDNAHLIWMEVTYEDNQRRAIDLHALDLASGNVRVLQRFELGYPEPIDWLNERLLLVAQDGHMRVVDVVSGGWAVLPTVEQVIGVLRSGGGL